MRHALALAFGVICLTPASVPAPADAPKAYACQFGEGGAWSWEKGGFQAKPAQGFGFEIDQVDVTSQAARLRRAEGQAPLRIVQAVEANHFIEVAVEGFLNITTIYEKEAGGGQYPAVHSRHFAVLGEPLVSQYRGTCRAKG